MLRVWYNHPPAPKGPLARAVKLAEGERQLVIAGQLPDQLRKPLLAELPAAPIVILAVDDFDSLLETLEILSDRSAVADIREAEQQMAQGQIFSEEQVRAAVTNRRLP